MLDTNIPEQTEITYIRHEPSYEQLRVKTNRASFKFDLQPWNVLSQISSVKVNG